MKTMRTLSITVVTFAVALTSSVARAEKKKTDEKFCSSLSSLNEDLAKLDSMGPDTTIGDLKSTLKKAEKQAKEVSKEAHKMKSPAAKQFADSANQLKADIPDNTTVSEAKTQIRDRVANVKQSTRELASESGCPGAMPTHDTSGTTEPKTQQP